MNDCEIFRDASNGQLVGASALGPDQLDHLSKQTLDELVVLSALRMVVSARVLCALDEAGEPVQPQTLRHARSVVATSQEETVRMAVDVLNAAANAAR